MTCIYKHTFPNGTVYIGKIKLEPEERWLNGFGYRNSPMMFQAIVKYGWDNVKHEILYDNLTDEEATQKEAALIQEYALSSEIVYNVQGIPAQYLAQESHRYTGAQSTGAQYKPHTTDAQYGEHRRYKDYIVPITEKPEGVWEWPIDVYDKFGNYICQYPTAKVASQELGVNNGDIISCCKGVKANGKPRYQVKGFIFRYAKQ